MNCPKKTPPKEGQIVTVLGCDTWGEWRMSAIRKDYKKKPNVFAFKDGDKYWRFIHPETQAKINFVECWIDYAGHRIKSILTSEELDQRERLNQRLAGRSGSVAGWHIDDAFPPHLD